MLCSEMTIELIFQSTDETLRVIAQPQSVLDAPRASELAPRGGSVEFADVSFAYGDGRDAVHDINLVIPAGQDSAVFEISILPDTVVEPAESFAVTLTSANGAQWDAASVAVRIRNTNRPAVVNAPARIL